MCQEIQDCSLYIKTSATSSQVKKRQENSTELYPCIFSVVVYMGTSAVYKAFTPVHYLMPEHEMWADMSTHNAKCNIRISKCCSNSSSITITVFWDREAPSRCETSLPITFLAYACMLSLSFHAQ